MAINGANGMRISILTHIGGPITALHRCQGNISIVAAVGPMGQRVWYVYICACC